jgi:hypothetical protein
VWITRGSGVWARRAALAAILIGAALVPGRVSSVSAGRCVGTGCGGQVAAIRWTRPLPGLWAAQSGALGTVMQQGQAYAAVGHGVAVVGFGATVMAYQLTTGRPLWTAVLAGFPPGSTVVSVRAWSGVVTAGVSIPAASTRATGTAAPGTGTGQRSGTSGQQGTGKGHQAKAGGHRAKGGGRTSKSRSRGALAAAQGNDVARRAEVVLSATNGSRIRTFPSAAYGGAVSASLSRTVVVSARAVTSYANKTGKVIWRRRTGSAAQAWRADGDDLLVTVARDGFLGPAPVTAIRRIDLRTGAQAMLHPAKTSFAGSLSGVIGGVMLFSGPSGLSAYSESDGRLLWGPRHGAIPEVVDPVREVVYVVRGRSLTGLDPTSGHVVTRAATPGAVGLYAVSGGVALGLDQGALGDAWGYDLASKRVIWTTRPLPWPHFFVDLSGIGGSSDPASQTIVLASCAQVGAATTSNAPPPCVKPRLVAIGLVQANGEPIPPRAAGTDR